MGGSGMASKSNIVLIGMRGSGKTTVAKLLAEKLGTKHIELDELIAQKAEQSIPEMVAVHGWDYFRDRESEAVREVSDLEDVIISGGGGVILRSENVAALQKNGICVLLRAPIETLIARIGEDPNRPSLTGKKSLREDLEEVSRQREQLYEQAADAIVDTGNKNPEATVEEIMQVLSDRDAA